MTTYVKGQQVLVVFARGVRSTGVITMLGRTWVHCHVALRGIMRFDAATGRIDGGKYGSPGTIYPDAAEYDRLQSLRTAWHAFGVKVLEHSRPPPGVNLKTIEAARAALFPTP